MINKLSMKSKDIISDNIDKISELFPNCISEGKINFEMLKQELSKDIIEDGKERYQLTWAGKQQAILNANIPTRKTLRPMKSKSIDFDNTKNIYIEGDNLEALKILQNSYLNKIKCIYIDPPYNTGNDFVYNDNFYKTEKEELIEEGRMDEKGNILTSRDINNNAKGKFHSSWISMIYSRIKLARNLLKMDGAIYISIDENEIINLRKICDEIFGERNFVASIKVLSNPRGRQSSNFFATAGEYVVIYAKDIDNLKIIGAIPDESQTATYNKKDEKGKYREIGLRKRGSDSRREDSPTLFFPIYYNPITEDISLNNKEDYIEIIPKLEDGSLGRWRWSKAKIITDIDQLLCRKVKRNNGYEYDIFQKDYLDESNRVKHKDFWIEKEINYDRSSEEIRDIFDDKIFDYAKPLYLINKIINTIVEENEDAIIMDFFSGSATTAHSILGLNAKDNGRRKYILVQLPEKIGYKDYNNICEIGEERIRRAGKKIKEETNADIDYGFRVYEVDSSNMKDVYYTPTELQQSQLNMFESSVKDDRTSEDLLTQVILDLGLTLDLSIEEKKILNNNVYFVESNSLVACFDNTIDINIIDEICKFKPLRIVFKESSFKTDSDKINTFERIKKMSPETEVNII